MRRPAPALIAAAVFALAAVLAAGVAFLAVAAVEQRSAAAVRSRLLADGITWATVSTDGLRLTLTGTAPTESARFRAFSLAGSVVATGRVHDGLAVPPVSAIEPPRFSVEILRNDDGISLIGLVPGAQGRVELATRIAALTPGVAIGDMLESAAFPAPEGWQAALDFGLEALTLLPRAKISIAADRVAITAISGSTAEQRGLESALAARAPKGLTVAIAISAPRPVLTPFTLRFVLDGDGARFDACSADSDAARDRIIAAAVAAGADGKIACTIGLGVPSPSWADAASVGIAALAKLGGGSLTFADADITLLAAADTPQATFDRVVGELQAALPPVFSLAATLPPKPVASAQGPAEFTATLAADGQVQLRGRLTDPLLRNAVDSYARARFGASRVYTATRLDPELPVGWPVRVLAGLESLGELVSGDLLVRADTVEISGVTGSLDARARITQVLSGKLGQGQTFKVSVRYDEALDPLAALPTPAECMADISATLTRQKITFAPGSTEIAAAAGGTLDALAKILIDCPDLKLEIAGHTDAQGSSEGNRALSQARAEAVLMALQGRRVPVTGLTAAGYGEDRPLADNGSDAGREANRRIEFTRLFDAVQNPAAGAFAAAGLPPVPPGTPDPGSAAPALRPPAKPDNPEPEAGAGGPDFAADTSPSLAPAAVTLRPRPRPETR
ncbi:MAG: OmpA family protein [Pseudorhodobacter sp.]|nr:OmpA family protein [Pseudorhodobacter sp.]